MAKDENELKQNIQVAGRVLAPQTEQVDLRMEEARLRFDRAESRTKRPGSSQQHKNAPEPSYQR